VNAFKNRRLDTIESPKVWLNAYNKKVDRGLVNHDHFLYSKTNRRYTFGSGLPEE
jgi:hypothetical protein